MNENGYSFQITNNHDNHDFRNPHEHTYNDNYQYRFYYIIQEHFELFNTNNFNRIDMKKIFDDSKKKSIRKKIKIMSNELFLFLCEHKELNFIELIQHLEKCINGLYLNKPIIYLTNECVI